jgi:hypothetical protein
MGVKKYLPKVVYSLDASSTINKASKIVEASPRLRVLYKNKKVSQNQLFVGKFVASL